MMPLTAFGMTLLSVAVLIVLLAPRRWALVSMLVVSCYFTQSQGVLLWTFNLFSIRIVILAGVLRIVLRGEFHGLRRSPLDPLMLVWSLWALTASFFRSDPAATLTFNGGLVFNSLGTYFMLRVFCSSREEVLFLCRVVAWLLVPIALEMVYEKLTATNLFSMLGDQPIVPEVREGRIRAQGPFAHAILAGTVGAVMLPVCVGLWKSHRFTATVGALASATIVLTSASSGPKLSAIFALFGLMLWPLRANMRWLRWLALGTYLMLMLVMPSPPYYLMAHLDLSGGSTGWYRSRLIESSMERLGEWWFAGTDYTRHWMQTGVGWSTKHVDLTNHYLVLGVAGGLPLLLLFVLLLSRGFAIVGQLVRATQNAEPNQAVFYWALGVSLFAHAASTISVSYFDQSFVFLYVTLASIAGVGASELVSVGWKPPHLAFSRTVLLVHRLPSGLQR